jgi:hypothetical protein
MKLYTLSECYTSDERGAEGYISDVFLYKSKEEAVAKMKDLMSYKAEEELNYEENVIMHRVDPSRPQGVIVSRAKAYDYYRGIYSWEIYEYEIEL